MNPADEFDPVDDLLARHDAGEPSEQLRERALARTLPVLRRRRWIRRAGWGAAFAGCYLAGMATMGAWQSSQASKSVVEKAPTMPAVPRQQTSDGPELVQRQKSPFERLRDAGDEAWQAQGNLDAAIRLYGEALEVATPEEMKISATDDNWLLMALKQDHVEEDEDVDNHDES
jgi:hypothetical protein